MPLIQNTDLRVQKTKEAIYAAFKQMICEMDASKITIKELTDRARIHYKTFYLHYTCIEALFEDVIGQMLEEYFHEIDQIPIDAPFTETNRVFFEFMAKQEPYMERVILEPSYREFAGRGFLSMMQHNRTRHNPYAAFSKEEQNIINTYLCATSINLYRQWVDDRKAIPLKEMIQLSGTLLNNGINALVKGPVRS